MMRENKISSKDYAELILKKVGKERAVSEVFRLMDANCIDTCRIGPQNVDAVVRLFKEGKKDVQNLAKLIDLLDTARQHSSEQDRSICEQITEYIEKTLFERISVGEIANRFHISYYYMCHLFKSEMGKSIVEYRTERRMQAAARYIVQSDEKIMEIAIRCGFDSVSYFAEQFTKYTGMSPTSYRAMYKGKRFYFPHFTEQDICLYNRLELCHLLEHAQNIPVDTCTQLHTVHNPDAEYNFLCEAAIVEFKGKLYSSWYNCSDKKVKRRTSVRGRRSADGGKTWSDIEVIADDPTGNIQYGPSVYGISDGKLYMMINEMILLDHVCAVHLYVLDETSDTFCRLWSKPISFKLNTNTMRLPNGKLMISGGTAEYQNFTSVPAVLISDSGKMDGDWRVVKVAENCRLPDGAKLVHPETCPIITENQIYLFCRNDNRHVPLLYVSEDNGENWSGPKTHDIPLVNSKIYCGRLSDGRNYIIGNIEKTDRSKLMIYFSEKNSMRFTKSIQIPDGKGKGVYYPSAYEYNGKLYVTYTENWDYFVRSTKLAIVNLENI